MDVFSGVRRISTFVEGAYDVTGGITAYGEFLFSNRKSHNNGVQRIELQQFTGASMLPFFLCNPAANNRSEEHTSELQSLMRISYAVFCLKKKKKHQQQRHEHLYNINTSTN